MVEVDAAVYHADDDSLAAVGRGAVGEACLLQGLPGCGIGAVEGIHASGLTGGIVHQAAALVGLHTFYLPHPFEQVEALGRHLECGHAACLCAHLDAHLAQTLGGAGGSGLQPGDDGEGAHGAVGVEGHVHAPPHGLGVELGPLGLAVLPCLSGLAVADEGCVLRPAGGRRGIGAGHQRGEPSVEFLCAEGEGEHKHQIENSYFLHLFCFDNSVFV